MYFRLTAESREGKVVLKWLDELAEHDRGGRAELCRAASIQQALMCPAFHRLRRRLEAIGPDWTDYLQSAHRIDRLAAACALMAHVRAGGSNDLPHAMSHRAKGEERNRVSELRFRRLLDAPDDDALFSGLRRVLPMVIDLVDPLKVAEAVLFWGDRIKREWAYTYAWPDKTQA